MYKFGKNSKQRLETCHPDLQRVLNRAMEMQVMDFTVLEGHRSIERQQLLYKQGNSKIDGVTRKGKHNYSPSLAFDVAPFPIDWQDHRRFLVLAGVIHAAAAEEGVQLRWGGDWDGDWDMTEHSFVDLPHFELKGKSSC
jgi:hypothetical protein